MRYTFYLNDRGRKVRDLEAYNAWITEHEKKADNGKRPFAILEDLIVGKWDLSDAQSLACRKCNGPLPIRWGGAEPVPAGISCKFSVFIVSSIQGYIRISQAGA